MSASNKKKLRKEQELEQLTEKQQAARKEAKQTKVYTIVFICVIALVLVAFAGTLIYRSVSNSGTIEKNTKAVTIGDHTLSTAELNYYYMDLIQAQYSSWQSTYGNYMSLYLQMMGLNLTKSLDSQIRDSSTNQTWADYFLDTAIENARGTYALYDDAQANGFDTDVSANVDTTVSSMTLAGTNAGYSNLAAYLKARYGNGATEETFREYCRVSLIAQAYQSAHSDSLTYDDAAIRAYDAEHGENYNSFTYTTVYVKASDFLQGGTTDEDNKVTYSDEEKAASVTDAKEAADKLAEAKSTVELEKLVSLVKLPAANATELTTTQSKDILYTSVNSAFQEWVSDPSRVAGDTNVFPNESTTTDDDGKETTTTYGYYVVMFESSTNNVKPMANVRHLLVAFEGGTKDSNGKTTYSDEEKAAAKAKAEELLEQWKSGDATEDSFAELVKNNTADTASASTGGLYENINPGSNYVENFKNWALEDHQPGDTGIVETEYGYHIMYFVGGSEQTYRDYMIENQLHSDDMQSWYDGLVEATTVNVLNTSKIRKDLVLASSK